MHVVSCADVYQQEDTDTQCLFVVVEGECRILRDRESVPPATCTSVATPTTFICCDNEVDGTPRSSEPDEELVVLRLPTARTSCLSAATRIQYAR
jgi:hypothetical protein